VTAAARSGRVGPPRWIPFRAHPRLLIGIVCGFAVMIATRDLFRPSLRTVIGWDAGILCYLTLILAMAAQATPQTMQRRAAREDATRWIFLIAISGAAWFSMFALLGLLREARTAAGQLSVEQALLAGATILLSWMLAHTMFALHYAHDFYADVAAKRPAGLLFPGNPREPDYWDFLYFSLVVGMTCQVSDVQVAGRLWRRLVLAHGVVAFLFNTVVLALSINLLAGQL
jgi:uncharacterized membrane protein